MDIKRLLEKLDQFAGQAVGQKPGDQVRGTEKAKKGGKEHPFKGRLVGDSIEPANLLKDLAKLAEAKGPEWELAEEYARFLEAEFKDTGNKRPARKGSREDKVGKRGHKEQPRYTTVKEGIEGDGEEASAVVAEVIKLIGEGHTEVSPDVITTKVSAALGRPFMLKDLVAVNNNSPELQHYIDSINPSKIKFSTDILTVKNEDPNKEKARAQDGVAKMAARAASRPRLGEGIDDAAKDADYNTGHKKGCADARAGKSNNSKECISAQERKGYADGYKSLNEGWGGGGDRVSLPSEPSTYYHGTGQLYKEYQKLYDELVPDQGPADTIEGEVLRAASKIVYRHYNDGDEFNAASFSQLEPYIGKVSSYDDLAHKATVFALAAEGEYHPNTGWDCLDVMEYGPEFDDEDDGYDDYAEYPDDEDDLEENTLKPVRVGNGKWGIPKRTDMRRKHERELDQFNQRKEEEAATPWYEKPETMRQAKGDLDESNEFTYASDEKIKDFLRSQEGHPELDLGGKQKLLISRAKKELAKRASGNNLEEGWGGSPGAPDERAPRERDPDAEYDAMRTAKADDEAIAAQAKRPQTKVYTLTGRGPNMEPNYQFPGEYDSQEAADAARAKLMADPSTPNPRMIGISTRTKYLDEGKTVPVITAFRKGMEKIAASDMNPQAKQAAFDRLSAEFHKHAQAYSQAVKSKRKVDEYATTTPGAAPSSIGTAGTPAANTGTTPGATTDPNSPEAKAQAQKVAQATNALKAASGSKAPATNITKAIDAASQGKAVGQQDMKALEPMMDIIGQAAQDPKLANQFRTLAQQAKTSAIQQQQPK